MTRRNLESTTAETVVLGVMSSTPVWTHVDHTLVEAAVRMKDADIGMLFVVDADEVVGVVTDRDIVVRGIAEKLEFTIATVGDVMTRHVVHCVEGTTIEDAANLMAQERVHRLAVIDENCELTGTVSVSDLARCNGSDAVIARTVRAIMQPLATAKMPGHEDPTGGRARKSDPGSLHVYATQPRIRRR